MFSSWQTAFQQWLKADRRRITWVLILIVVSIAGMGLLFSWANNNNPAQMMVDGSADQFSSPFYYVGVFFKLFGIILLLVGLAYFAKRWKGKESFISPAAKRQMVLMESLRISPRQALHLVRVGEQILVVGATDTSLSLISAVEATPELLAKTTTSGTGNILDFGQLLSNQMKQTDRKDAASVPSADEK
ncbi:MAG: hypothetical protein CVU39_09640 [Chloroflexi bacterium HGW-Chloroflexi-10]|nr:MAG: hypothetical protein CVU39_09640 [Chloroflexi bacterium HGW-Chloroflexi-10]